MMPEISVNDKQSQQRETSEARELGITGRHGEKSGGQIIMQGIGKVRNVWPPENAPW